MELLTGFAVSRLPTRGWSSLIGCLSRICKCQVHEDGEMGPKGRPSHSQFSQFTIAQDVPMLLLAATGHTLRSETCEGEGIIAQQGLSAIG